MPASGSRLKPLAPIRRPPHTKTFEINFHPTADHHHQAINPFAPDLTSHAWLFSFHLVSRTVSVKNPEPTEWTKISAVRLVVGYASHPELDTVAEGEVPGSDGAADWSVSGQLKEAGEEELAAFARLEVEVKG